MTRNHSVSIKSKIKSCKEYEAVKGSFKISQKVLYKFDYYTTFAFCLHYHGSSDFGSSSRINSYSNEFKNIRRI